MKASELRQAARKHGMRFVVQDYGRLLFKMLRPMGFTGAPHERNISGDRTWTVFDVAKFTHPGVEVLPGSDQGPSSSVVAMQGLTELDAYLLVVDGVPYGGSFNPATATLDLFDFDRIEVI